MKKRFLIITVMLLVMSCSKETEVLPDAILEVSGEDSFDEFKKGKNLNLSVLPGDSFLFGFVLDISNQEKIVGDGVWVNGEYNLLDNYLDGSFEYAEGSRINNQGQIVGFVSDFATYLLPTYWDQYDSEVTILPIGDFDGGYAYGNNEQGQIVGFAGFTNRQAALWENDELIILPTGEYSNGWARDINNNGQIVGFLIGNNSPNQPAIWQNGQLSLLPTGEFEGGAAWRINNNGDIVGVVGNQPAYWKKGELTMLPLGEFESGFATAINNSKTIVGFVRSGNSVQPAMWKNGQLTLLPTGDYERGEAWGINDSGKVVGEVYNDGTHQPALWE